MVEISTRIGRSVYFDERSNEHSIDTIIIHSMYAEDSDTPFDAAACKKALDFHEVSAHYLIDREGTVYQCIPEDLRAWHAGESKLPFANDGRIGVNQFSIGVELMADKHSGYTEAQYLVLAQLCCNIQSRYAITTILGHNDVAPGRKTDPWGFDWHLFKQHLADQGLEGPVRLPPRIFEAGVSEE